MFYPSPNVYFRRFLARPNKYGKKGWKSYYARNLINLQLMENAHSIFYV